MKKKFAFAVAASLVLLSSSVFIEAASADDSTSDNALAGHASLNAGGIAVDTVSSASGKDKPASKKRPHMDVAFCIDTTGSMQGEIDMVKSKTKEMVAKLSTGKPAPVIRVGLVAYRDRGDAYVTKVFPFSEDIDQVVKDISDLQANGGGDGPEAVDQGLHAAIKDLRWDNNSHTAKILFLIGDAGPHGYPTDLDWRSDCREAIGSGIQINTMGCRGLESFPVHQGADVFKEIALLADGKYESLSYRQEVVNASGRRETIVHSGDSMYRVSAPAGMGWKDAMAHGLVKKMDAPAGMAGGASYASAGEAASFAMSATSAPSSPARAKSLSRATFATGGIAPAAMAAPVSRQDNNLDALMLDAAKAKAEKALHVDY